MHLVLCALGPYGCRATGWSVQQCAYLWPAAAHGGQSASAESAGQLHCLCWLHICNQTVIIPEWAWLPAMTAVQMHCAWQLTASHRLSQLCCMFSYAAVPLQSPGDMQCMHCCYIVATSNMLQHVLAAHCFCSSAWCHDIL